ncbi:MAG TPA: 1,4-alpha-glucan branching enzyme [candidate division Zixibacteria bacterium]|nr:1,4-alpha-glucan branching enzyme [candidate division Zixibacteria bacterium]
MRNVIFKGLLTDQDIYLFKEGNHFKLYEKLGSHLGELDGVSGTFFAVWAPNAARVSVVGDFNGWNPDSHILGVRWDSSGIWEGFIPGITNGALYKYHIISNKLGYTVQKADPFAFRSETPPKTASVVWDLRYSWQDSDWLSTRGVHNSLSSPISMYEVHAGSWRRTPEEDNRSLTYRELGDSLSEYMRDIGFTHVEFLPIMEHPFYGSWGYQTTGYFTPSSRFGSPQDFMYLVDALHKKNIGVILDWVPSHFPSDQHGLVYFDGTHLFEHADMRKGFHPDWNSYIFNYGRNEVRSFLISSAMFWMDKYHVDGIRVDAVASILYLDYSRKEGEWIPNEFGGRENLEAISFLKRLNEVIYGNYPDAITLAEESTAYPMVTRPTFAGGLGFGLKWNMGWMHDTLDYISKDPLYRKFHHGQLTFSIWYAFYENFVLSLSHDEVVYGKGSLLGKMPGDFWQKFANLRALFGYMFGHPGKKLLFMGDEFGQWNEWYHESSLDWHLLQYAPHKGLQEWVRELNYLYKNEKALYEIDFDRPGFEWIDFQDWESSVISFIRKGNSTSDIILVVSNFTPVQRNDYNLGVPRGGFWKEILNSDDERFGGASVNNAGGAEAKQISMQGRPFSLSLTLPGLSTIFLKSEG